MNANELASAAAAIAFTVFASPSSGQVVDRYNRLIASNNGAIFYGQPETSISKPSTSNVLHSPSGFPVFSGTGENFAFYAYVAFSVNSWADSVAIADVNGDNLNDVVLVTAYSGGGPHDNNLFIFLQKSDGALAIPLNFPYSDETWGFSTGLAIANLGDTTTNDILVGSRHGITRFRYTSPVYWSSLFFPGRDASALTSLDVNQDSRLDIVALSETEEATIFLGNGLGGFSSSFVLNTNNFGKNSLSSRDFDRDGRVDLLITTAAGQPIQKLNVHWGDGNSFVDPTSFGPDEPMAFAVPSNIDGDEHVDIVVSRPGNSPTWLQKYSENGNRTFSVGEAIPTYDIPETIASFDVNMDGLEDLMVLHGGWNAAGLYLQREDGSLNAEELTSIPYASHYQSAALALGDINGDGCSDAAIADYNSGLVVLYGHDCADILFSDGFEPESVQGHEP